MTTPAPTATPAAAPAGVKRPIDTGFFLKVGDEVYGPYRAERVRSFLGEGRISAHTPMARAATGPFRPVEEILDTREGDDGSARLLIAGRFGVAGAAIVEDALLSVGALTSAAPNVWLLEARLSAAEVRNRLSHRLDRNDAFVVARIDGRDAAWFNVGPVSDGALRAALDREGLNRKDA